MASISKCPRCQADLWIGDTSRPERQLRCPTCGAAFALHEVLANCTPAPPAALAVEESSAGRLPGGPSELDITGSAAEGAPQIDHDVGDALPPQTAPGRLAPSVDDATYVVSDLPPEIEPVDMQASAMGLDEYATSSPSGYRPMRPRQGPTTGGILRTLIGIVLGGVIGLALGYVALVNIGDHLGQEKDFLHLKPVVPWLFPWRAANEGVDGGSAWPEQKTVSLVPEPSPSPADVAPPATVEPAQPVTPPPPAPVISASSTSRSTPGSITSDRLGPRLIRPVSDSRLAQALGEVVRVLGCEHCNSTGFVEATEVVVSTNDKGEEVEEKVLKRVPCEICGGKPSGRITLANYDKLCQLAQAVTFVEVAPDDPALVGRRLAVASVVARAARDRSNVETLGRLAKEKLANDAREDDGILLAGTVTESVADGPLFRTTLVLAGTTKTVQVFSRNPQALQFTPRSHYALLGVVIDDPAKNLNGYTGKQEHVVWAGLPVPLDAE